MKKTLIVVDGNNFAHRAYNATPPLSTKDGVPTNILTGFTNMVNDLANTYKPEKMIIVFDAKGKTFRHEMYDDYKANREPLKEDFKIQMPILKEIMKAWGYPLLEVQGVEADDTMTTLGKEGEKLGYQVYLATSDKDMYQGITENIFILDTKKEDKKTRLMGREETKNKFNVYPEQIIDYLSLLGDKADNIIGVDGCGEKTAAKLLNDFGSIDGIKGNIEQIKGKLAENLKKAIDSGALEFAQKLVKIKSDVDYGMTIDKIPFSYDEDKLFKLLTKYNMKGLKKKLNLVDKNAESINLNIKKEDKDISEFLTTQLFKMSKLLVKTFCTKEHHYTLIGDLNGDNAYLLDSNKYKNELNKMIRLLTNNHEAIIYSFDAKETLKALYEITGNEDAFQINVEDVRVLDYIMNGGSSKLVSLEEINEEYTKLKLTDLRKKYKLDTKTPKTEKATEQELIEIYSDEFVLTRTFFVNETIEEGLKLFYREDNKLLKVLACMEAKGTLIDSNKLLNVGKELDLKLKNIQNEVEEITGVIGVKLNSPKQIEQLLYTTMNIPTKKKSTSEDMLKKHIETIEKNIKKDKDNSLDIDLLKNQIKVMNLIMDYRSLFKLRTTYVDGLTNRMESSGRVHTNYNSTVTSTGRLSSTDPNLQNIPIRSEDGKLIRNAFVAKEGYKLVILDYSQIELRILAHVTKDPVLLNAFNSGEDIHAKTASEILGIEPCAVTKDQRRIAKAINFGLIYGMSERRLAVEAGIEKKEAKIYYNGYFDTYKHIKPYFEETKEMAQEKLYVETIFGRKIDTSGVASPNSIIRSHAERAAINAPIQGTASDILKKVMIKLFKPENKDKLHGDLLMQVHDELIFEIKEEYANESLLFIKEIMENIVKLDVPLIVDSKVQQSWY